MKYGIMNWGEYEGEWKDNLKNGKGVLIRDGIRYEGTWKDEEMISSDNGTGFPRNNDYFRDEEN